MDEEVATTKTIKFNKSLEKLSGDNFGSKIENDTKRIILIKETKEPKETKETKDNLPKTRKIAEKWSFESDSLSSSSQFAQLENFLEQRSENITDTYLLEIHRQINYKIHSYRSQDIKKSLYDESQFVDYTYISELLREKQLLCFYCRKSVSLMYDTVRDGKQWTLDRIDNSIGHNRGNVEIACLTCNLRRRTMYHERYVFTKQMSVIKQDKFE